LQNKSRQKERCETMITQRRFGLLVANGALVMLAGFAIGFPYGVSVLHARAGAAATGPLGDTRAWHMAHLEGVLNGMLILAGAAAARTLPLGTRGASIVFWGFVAAGWTNVVASTISALTGGRGTHVTGFDWNTFDYALFMAGIVGAVAAAVALAGAGLRAARDMRLEPPPKS
jgi:hypothetical protein